MSVVLTGIKPTGDLHIGNYLGAIEPALNNTSSQDSYFFIADLHALNQEKDPQKIHQYTLSVAAAWLASGLDPDKIVLYRQSDIPQVSELTTILSAVTQKSLMNKAHAYKAARDENMQKKRDPDAGINMGLYTYPVLMAADILLLQTDLVPVGQDQVQHVEITQDIAQNFNRTYNKKVFNIPQYYLQKNLSTVPGLDGRKMSKSYNNTIPLFATPDIWEKVVKKIVTDSDISDPKNSPLYLIYRSIASEKEAQTLLSDLENKTIGWKEAKDRLLETIIARFSDMSRAYFAWLESPQKIEEIFAQGKEKVIPIAQKTLISVKTACGLL